LPRQLTIFTLTLNR